MDDIVIRDAQLKDVPSINNIYNQAVSLKFSTADSGPVPLQHHNAWFKTHKKENNPIKIAESDGTIVGWNSLSFYRFGRPQLLHVRETSYYISKEYRNNGIGTKLLQSIINYCPHHGVSKLIAYIIDHNKASIRLMNKFSFELWGQLPGAVTINGKEYDHLIFGKKLNNN